MSDRRNELRDMTTNPGTPEVDASEDANTAVINPPSESQPTAPIPAQIKGTAPAPRLKTAPYMIFDAVSAKDDEARKNPALHGTGSQPVAVITPEGESGSAEGAQPKLTGGGSNTIPGPGPKAPGASPKSNREILPVKGPEPIPMNSANEEAGPSGRVVSATGAFIGGILAIAIVAGGAVVALIVKGTPQPPPVPTIPAATTSAPPTTPPATSTDPTNNATKTSAAPPTVSATTSTTTSATTSEPPTVADDKPYPKETGNKPSKQALDRLLATLKPVLTACVKGQQKALYSVKITFEPATGRATDAQTFVPLTKTVAGGCVLGASYDARVNPYNGPPFTAEVKFAP